MRPGPPHPARWRSDTFFSRPAEPLRRATHRTFADAHAGRRFPLVAVGREGRIGSGIELGDEGGMDGGRDGARSPGAGLGCERGGGTPLRDVAFDAVETDVVA